MHESDCIGKKHFRLSPVFVKKVNEITYYHHDVLLIFRSQNKILLAFLHIASFLYHLRNYQISRWQQEMKFGLNTTVNSAPPKISFTV